MSKHSLVSASVLLAGLVALGCGKGDKQGGDTSTGTAGDDTSAAASKASDLRSLCERICDRSVECAVPLAKSQTKGMPEEDAKKQIEDATKSAKEQLPKCKKECEDAEKTATPKDRAQSDSVRKCVGTKGCDKYMKCMSDIDN